MERKRRKVKKAEKVKITPLDKADKIDPMSLAGVWDNEAGAEIAKYAKQLRKTAKFIRG